MRKKTLVDKSRYCKIPSYWSNAQEIISNHSGILQELDDYSIKHNLCDNLDNTAYAQAMSIVKLYNDCLPKNFMHKIDFSRCKKKTNLELIDSIRISDSLMRFSKFFNYYNNYCYSNDEDEAYSMKCYFSHIALSHLARAVLDASKKQ